MTFNLYVANHGKLAGIEDFISIIRSVIERRGHQLEVSEDLRADTVNIVIDEFTNAIRNYEIIDFKDKNPDAELVLVMTEFIERTKFVTTFNFFRGFVDASIVSALNVYIKRRRKDFNPPNLKDYFNLFLYLPVLSLALLKHFLFNLRGHKGPLSARYHNLIYLHMRFLGLEKMLPYFDSVILSHDMIERGVSLLDKNKKIVGTLSPEIDFDLIKEKLFHDKELYIEITGSVTPFRKSYIDKINMHIQIIGMRNVFGFCKSISFSSQETGISMRGAYSLHPPQTKSWKYASPTRIYRALQYDNNMPVLTKNFDQHPIEELCLLYQDEQSLIDMYKYYKNKDELIHLLAHKVKKYSELVNSVNDKIVDHLVGLASNNNHQDLSK